MVTIKKVPKEYAQKEMRKGYTCFATKISCTQKKTVMQEMRNKKAITT